MRRPDPNAARDRRTVDLRKVFGFVNGSGLPGRWGHALTTTENAGLQGSFDAPERVWCHHTLSSVFLTGRHAPTSSVRSS
jgi:hypothetical protein